MRKFITLLSAFVLGIAFLSSSFIPVFADEKKDLDSLKSKYMVLMDYDSGNVLYEKNADQKMYPASTTKIWTAFCVLKKCKDLNQVIEIKDMPQVQGSSMYLENGEKFTVYELLESLLIHSSNDVAFVLARYFGDGDASKFIAFMNKEAVKYGAKQTHFHNPHGLPDEEHYTTAMDMTTLARVAYSNDVIKKIVGMKSVSFKKGPNCKLDREMYNSNRFLTSLQTMEYKGKIIPIKYEIVDGMKTGFTDDAGNCLLSTAKKNGSRLIAGVFLAPGGALYHDSRTLLDYGFDSFKTITILDKKDFEGQKKVKFAKPAVINYTLANDYTVTVNKKDNISKSDYKTKISFNNLKLPITKGDIIGTMNVVKNGGVVSSIAIVAENNSISYWDYLLDKFSLGKKEEPKDEPKEEPEQKEEKQEEPKEEQKQEEKKEDKQENSEQKEEKSPIDKVGSTARKSVNGIIGIFSGIGDLFSDIGDFFKNIKNFFTGNIIKNFEATDLYRFLDQEVSKTISFVPSKVIIYGVPLLILIVILVLVIGIIADALRERRKAKLIKKQERKRRKEERKQARIDAKKKKKEDKKKGKEMSVSDIVSKEETIKEENQEPK